MHVYASLQDAKRYSVDEGIGWGAGSTNDALALSILESVSRRVDGWARRSAFGSGFGPRIGTNVYDAAGGTTLYLRDDILEVTGLVTRAATAGATTTPPVADSDFYLINDSGDYATGPFRALVLHGAGTFTRFGTGRKIVELAVVAGHQDVTVPLTTMAEAVNNTVTDMASNDPDLVSPGNTLLIDAEQLYVRAILYTDDAPTGMTVVRGVNGTTAASHLDNAPVSRYVYDARVVSGALEVWGKRWGARNANGDGSEGGGFDVVTKPLTRSEQSILFAHMNDLRMAGPVIF
jgi:hypothetical protein